VTSPIDYLDSPPRSAELVVIGGGIIGAATAFYASRAGLRPLIVERRPALCSLTTPASTGAFRLQFDNSEELGLVRESVEVFLNFPEVTGQNEYDPDIKQQGYLWVTTDEARAERQRHLVELQHSWGQTDIELVAGEDVRERWPFISPDVLQARWRAGDGFLDPKQLTMGLVAGAGANVVVSCGVTGFGIEGDRLSAVQTERGSIATDTAVIAAGPFSGVVASFAGVKLPIEAVLRQKLVMPDVDLVPADAPMIIDDDTGAHWRPALQGAYLLFTDPETPPSEPSEVLPLDHSLAFRLLDPASPVSAARVAPFWSEVWERNTHNWMLQGGQYDMTPDHRPLLGPTPVEGLYVNCGYSGHGIMGSAAGSRHLTDVLTRRIQADQNPFRLDRTFEERELDLL
jgi:D-hydroxyproline dehydrogenase subunit beta